MRKRFIPSLLSILLLLTLAFPSGGASAADAVDTERFFTYIRVNAQVVDEVCHEVYTNGFSHEEIPGDENSPEAMEIRRNLLEQAERWLDGLVKEGCYAGDKASSADMKFSHDTYTTEDSVTYHDMHYTYYITFSASIFPDENPEPPEPFYGAVLTGRVSSPSAKDVTGYLFDAEISDQDAFSLQREPVQVVSFDPGNETLRMAGVPLGKYKLMLRQSGQICTRILPITVDGDLDLGQITLRRFGDLDMSGDLSAIDILNLQLSVGSRSGCISELVGEERDYAFQAADVDANGRVDALDVLNMQLYIGSRTGAMAGLE